jgi:hypothetical protein
LQASRQRGKSNHHDYSGFFGLQHHGDSDEHERDHKALQPARPLMGTAGIDIDAFQRSTYLPVPLWSRFGPFWGQNYLYSAATTFNLHIQAKRWTAARQ